MNPTTEAFSRVKIDALLRDAGWNLTDGVSVLFEHAYCRTARGPTTRCATVRGGQLRRLRPSAHSINPIAAQDQGRHYAEQLGVPFVFLSNGEEVWFLGPRDGRPRAEDRHLLFPGRPGAADRRPQESAGPVQRRDRPAGRGSRVPDSRALRRCPTEVSHGRRKLLVEMATGTGKTRTAAAFVKRLFEAGIVTRVLFLVDRIALAGQAEDAFKRSSARLFLPRTPAGPGLRPDEADHHRDVADDDHRVPRPVVGLLRSGDHRRVPSLDLWGSGAAFSGTSTASSSA